MSVGSADVPEEALASMETTIKSSLSRKMDMVLRNKRDFYILLYELKRENMKVVIDRIEGVLTVPLSTATAFFPEDGGTSQELLRRI